MEDELSMQWSGRWISADAAVEVDVEPAVGTGGRGRRSGRNRRRRSEWNRLFLSAGLRAGGSRNLRSGEVAGRSGEVAGRSGEVAGRRR